MKLSLRRLLAALVVASCATSAVTADAAKHYPVRPIRMIMPIGPGSSNDTLGRILANYLGQILGQQVVVDNRPGAGGVLGMSIASHEMADGYTIVAGSAAALSIAPHVHKKLPYDPLKSFVPIGQFAVTPNILIVNNSLPVHSISDFIKYAKAKNGKLDMASAGVGSQSHLTGVMFMLAAGIKSLHVPYKGGGGTLAVRSGEVQWQLPPAPAVMGLIRSGQVRALGHTLPHPTPVLPNIPPIADTLPGFSYSGWNGLLAPKGTPPAIIKKLHDAMVEAVNSPEARKEFTLQATEIHTSTPAEFQAFIKKELEKSGELVKAAGLKVE